MDAAARPGCRRTRRVPGRDDPTRDAVAAAVALGDARGRGARAPRLLHLPLRRRARPAARPAADRGRRRAPDPPFLGQGMCAGIRDAANLAWKLAEVVQGRAPQSLLDTCESERSPHVREFIEAAVRLGGVIQTTDPEAARRRDAEMSARPLAFTTPAPRLGHGARGGGRPRGGGRRGFRREPRLARAAGRARCGCGRIATWPEWRAMRGGWRRSRDQARLATRFSVSSPGTRSNAPRRPIGHHRVSTVCPYVAASPISALRSGSAQLIPLSNASNIFEALPRDVIEKNSPPPSANLNQ